MVEEGDSIHPLIHFYIEKINKHKKPVREFRVSKCMCGNIERRD